MKKEKEIEVETDFDCSSVFPEYMCRGGPWIPGVSVPQTHHVTVSSAGQESTTGRPPETTDVPRLTVDRTDVELGLADVVVVNFARLGGGGEEVGARIPGQGVDSRVVGAHGPHELLGIDVPELLRQGKREHIIMCKYTMGA